MLENEFFPEIHGNFGFGCMRLPMKNGKVDYDEFCRMAERPQAIFTVLFSPSSKKRSEKKGDHHGIYRTE